MLSIRKWIMSRFFLQIILLFVMIETFADSLQCRDESNNDVDWYVAYKLPRIKKSNNPLLNTGLAYLYITSNTVSQGWILSSKSINDSESLPGCTLQALYDASPKESDSMWVLYNDETPNKTVTFELGHTKGVAMSWAEGGFWLVHSVPHFPPLPNDEGSSRLNHYSYPSSGTHFGQSFLCLSLSANQMDNVGLQLMYNEPQIYGSNVPSDLEHSLPHLVAAIKKTKISSAPWYHQVPLTTQAGVQFQAFAKTSKFGKDLYADWVAPILKTNLLVETWRNGPGRMPSECTMPYKVNNVDAIKLQVAGIEFKAHVDHSKWAVSTSNVNPWVCIGDINRMLHQEKRGGGTVCISHPRLWFEYQTAIAKIAPCDHFIHDEFYDSLLNSLSWL